MVFSSEQLVEGDVYTRQKLREMFDIKDATLNNGVFRPAGFQSVWLFITEQKTSDRPQLKDLLEGDVLYWDGQPLGRTDKLVIEHEEMGLELLVFYRKRREEFGGYGFKYEGRFRYVSHNGSRPAHFVLQRFDTVLDTVEKDIEALKVEETEGVIYSEGKRSVRLVNEHERNPRLRAAAVKAHGTRCQVCGFSFAEVYGEHGKDFIEIHHLNPVSLYTGEVTVDPVREMAALCANCHRMIHRRPDKLLSVEELRRIVDTQRLKGEV